jgi:uncharacterized protein (DUF302 family)
MNVEGLIVLASDRGPEHAVDELAAAVERHGMTVVARIDHAAAAVQVGMALRPTTVLVFGNPAAGTPLMDDARSIGIDLPLKALVWQGADGRTWLAYNDPRHLARRHGVGRALEGHVDAMARLLADVAAEAAGRAAGEGA